MSVPKGQHYVTQAYLRGFATGAGKKARLYVYERGRGEPYQQPPEKVAKQNYYYSFEDENGNRDHSVEEFLGMLESSAMPVITRLANDDFQPNWEERGWLASFIAMHEVRVPWMREGLDEITSNIIRHATKMRAGIPGGIERTVERMKAAGKEISPDAAKHLREVVEEDLYDIEIDPRHSLALMVKMIPDLMERYSEMKWTIARTWEDHPYFTCDNPVVRVNPRITDSFYDSHGLDNKNVEIRFPLNGRTALLIMHDMQRVERFSELVQARQKEEAIALRQSVAETRFMQAPAQLVEAVNIGTALWARRFVYAASKHANMGSMMGNAPGGLWPQVG